MRERKPSVNAERPPSTISDVPTAVVTGGAGFLGSHLCEYLLGRGLRVICVDNLVTGSLGNIEHIRDDDFVFLNHDLTEHLGIDEPVDFVYHFAALASPVDYLRMPLHSLKVGSYGTHNALGLAKFKRARFLLASTSEVYGDPQVHPQPETYWGHVNPIGPRGVYDEAKRYAEALTMAYHSQQGVNTGIVRIFNTYGPRMRPHDGRAIPTFVRQALANEPLTVFGDGSQTRSFCYVDDLVRGLVLLAESGEHFPVNIGNPGEFTILELAQAVLKVTGSSSEIVYEALPVDDPQVRQPDITRARQVLGWEPEIQLEDGLRRMLGKGARRCLARGGSWRRPWRPPPASACPRPPRPWRPPRRPCPIGVYDEGQTFFGNLDQVFSQLQSAPRRRPPREPLLGRPARRREDAVRSRRATRAMPPTTGRSTTGPSSTRQPPGSSCCSRSPARRGGRTAARARTGRRGTTRCCAGSPTPRRRATAATYVGNDGRALPAVRLWAAWNEPNNPIFLRPQFVQEKGKWVIQSAPRLRQDLQRRLRGRARDACTRASRSPAASRRRAGTTTRRAPGRRSRRSRSSPPRRRRG